MGHLMRFKLNISLIISPIV